MISQKMIVNVIASSWISTESNFFSSFNLNALSQELIIVTRADFHYWEAQISSGTSPPKCGHSECRVRSWCNCNLNPGGKNRILIIWRQRYLADGGASKWVGSNWTENQEGWRWSRCYTSQCSNFLDWPSWLKNSQNKKSRNRCHFITYIWLQKKVTRNSTNIILSTCLVFCRGGQSKAEKSKG